LVTVRETVTCSGEYVQSESTAITSPQTFILGLSDPITLVVPTFVDQAAVDANDEELCGTIYSDWADFYQNGVSFTSLIDPTLMTYDIDTKTIVFSPTTDVHLGEFIFESAVGSGLTVAVETVVINVVDPCTALAGN